MCRARKPDRGDEDEREQHRRREAVHAAHRRAPRDPVREHDVGGEEGRVGECEGDADRLAGEANVRQ